MEDPAFIDQPESTTEQPEANERDESVALSDTSETQAIPLQDELVDTSNATEIIPVDLEERVTDTTFKMVNKPAFGGMKMGFGRLYDQAKEVGNVAQNEAEATLSYLGQAGAGLGARFGSSVGENVGGLAQTQNTSPPINTSNLFSIAKKFVEQAKVEADRTGKQVEDIVNSVFGIEQSRETMAMINNHVRESEALAEKHADELFNKAKEIVSQNNRIGEEVVTVAEVLSGVEAQSLVQSAVLVLDQTRRLTDAREREGASEEAKLAESEVGSESESEVEAKVEAVSVVGSESDEPEEQKLDVADLSLEQIEGEYEEQKPED